METLPVKGGNGRWLAPCSPARARQLMREGKAVMREATDGAKYLLLRAPAHVLNAEVTK